jgi:hypothetical protein
MNPLCMQLLTGVAFFAEYEPPDYCPSIEFVPAAKLRRYICPAGKRPTAGPTSMVRNAC